MKNKVSIKVAKAVSPTDSQLEKAGWTIEATPDPKKTDVPLANSGRKASDKPSKKRVLTDQDTPVTASATKGDQSTVFAALRLAEIESDLGLLKGDKLARIAELEEGYNLERLNERISTLQSVREAGLASRTTQRVARSLPRMADIPVGKTSSSTEEIPDEAIF